MTDDEAQPRGQRRPGRRSADQTARPEIRRHSRGGRYFPFVAADALDPDEIWRFTDRPIAWIFAVLRGDRGNFLFACVLNLLFSMLALLPAIVVGRFVDTVLRERDFRHLAVFLTLMVLIPVIRSGMLYTFRHIFDRIGMDAMLNIRHAIYRHLQRLDQSFYSETPTGTVMANMTGDLEAIRHFVAFAAFSTIEQIFLFVIGISYLLSVSIPLALATLVMAPPIFLIIRRFSRHIRPMWSQIRSQFERLNDVVQQNISGNRVTRAFVRRDHEIERFEAENQKYRNAHGEAAQVRARYIPALDAVASFMSVPIIILGGYLVIRGQISIGELVTFNGLLWVLQNPTRIIGFRIDDIQRFSTSAAKIIDLLATRSAVVDPAERPPEKPSTAVAEEASEDAETTEDDRKQPFTRQVKHVTEASVAAQVALEHARHDSEQITAPALDPAPLKRREDPEHLVASAPPDEVDRHGMDARWLRAYDERRAAELAICPLRGEIEFRNVSFRYPRSGMRGKGEDSLKSVSFRVPPGSTIGIMGSTGSGKSTLLSLIPRIHDASSGTVLIDGVDVRRYPLEALRRNIGVVTQDVFLFSDSVHNNIAYGRPDIDDEAVRAAAGAAAAGDFIPRMSEGYDTIIGERGVGLSGGQRQRISLARALLIDARILILDDTTSAVDMETDRLIRASLAERRDERTTLIVASRIASIRDADCIYILENGEIVESGTHDELIALDAYYADIFRTQMGQIRTTLDDLRKAGSHGTP
ncbi:MAG: ABC transporter ATP-binding protein [Bacillota bacterium]|nr:ABC transporter ATP-binding protein [Bacillota bacterium]